MEFIDIANKQHASVEASPHPVPEVVFIGNSSNFSPSLISATTQELGGVLSEFLPSFNHLHILIERVGIYPTLLVIDEPVLRHLSGTDRDFLMASDGTAIGLAFNTAAFGAACYNDPDLRARAASIFPLNVRLDVWLSIIRLIAHGGNYVCPDVMSADEPAQRIVSDDDNSLTQRQIDVLQLVADGQPNKRIADLLGLSVHTVKLHLHNASQRLGARNRTEAAMRFRTLSK